MSSIDKILNQGKTTTFLKEKERETRIERGKREGVAEEIGIMIVETKDMNGPDQKSEEMLIKRRREIAEMATMTTSKMGENRGAQEKILKNVTKKFMEKNVTKMIRSSKKLKK